MSETDFLSEVHCTGCGRFLGYAGVTDGLILLLCKNCKGWTVIAEGQTGNRLTGEDIYGILPNRGRKV